MYVYIYIYIYIYVYTYIYIYIYIYIYYSARAAETDALGQGTAIFLLTIPEISNRSYLRLLDTSHIAETALQPMMSHSEGFVFSDVLFSRGMFLFTDTGMCAPLRQPRR